MQDWSGKVLGLAFGISLIVFFGMGKIPLEVFAPIMTAAILWLFREKEIVTEIKKIRENLKK